MSVNEFYKIDLSDGTAAQLLDICRYAPCTEAIIRCAAVIDTPLPAGADDTQANALLLPQSEAISNSAVNHGWKVTDSQHVSDKETGKRYLRTVLTPDGLPLAILPEVPQEAQVRLETAVRKVVECVKVVSKTEIEITFKGGFDMTVEVKKRSNAQNAI